MKGFYELFRDNESQITISNRSDYSYPLHFHGSVEILILLRGEYKIVVDNQTYLIKDKNIAIADSFCLHSMEKTSEGPSDSMLILVPSSLLTDYNDLKDGKRLASSIVENEEIVDEIHALACYMKKHDDDPQIKQLYINSILYLIFQAVGLTSAHLPKNISIIKEVLSYIEENYTSDITLDSIAKHFGYSTCHLSRLFHSYMNVSIPRYINNKRIQYILSKKKTEKLFDLIEKAGFNSPQTYYRNLQYYTSNK